MASVSGSSLSERRAPRCRLERVLILDIVGLVVAPRDSLLPVEPVLALTSFELSRPVFASYSRMRSITLSFFLALPSNLCSFLLGLLSNRSESLSAALGLAGGMG